jgi:hypothetical protein
MQQPEPTVNTDVASNPGETARLDGVFRPKPSTAGRQTPAFSIDVVAIELGMCQEEVSQPHFA